MGFANEAPYAYATATGELTGEAPEVAREVMRRLGVAELDGVLTTFASLIPDLQQGRFDIIAAGMFITPERCREILFSDPDYCVQQAFLVPSGNPLGIRRYEDIAANPHVELGTLNGAVEVSQAEESGVAAEQLKGFDSPQDLLAALSSGRIDAVALTTISIARLVENSELEGFEVTEGFAHDGHLGCGAFGFRKEDHALRDDFNGVLNQMKTDGEIKPIVQEFGFAEASNASKGLTAEDLCATEGDKKR